MRQRIRHGAEIDVATPDEVAALLKAASQEPPRLTRIRQVQVVALDGSGNGRDEVYRVPAGYEFQARRVSLDLSTAQDPSTGSVALNIAGKYIAYLRSGARIAYGMPLAPTAISQVPGVETWSAEEGPYLRASEVFEVQAVGLTPNAALEVTLQGLLELRPRV